MKRFFFLSIFFHGALFLTFFSWQVPLADRMFSENIIKVSLVERIEEAKSQKVLPRIGKEPGKMKSPEIREVLLPPEKREIKREEAREEKTEPAPAILKEERQKEDKPAPPENKAPTSQVDRPSGAQAKIHSELQEEGNLDGWRPLFEGKRGPGAGEALSSTFLASAASLVGAEIGLGGKDGTPVRTKGEGPPGPMASIDRSSGGGVDPIFSLILRKLETAKRYPRMARKMGIEGTAVVRFKLKPEGGVEAVEVVDSSGSEILDKASLETVRAAAPFPYKEGWLKVGIVFKIL